MASSRALRPNTTCLMGPNQPPLLLLWLLLLLSAAHNHGAPTTRLASDNTTATRPPEVARASVAILNQHNGTSSPQASGLDTNLLQRRTNNNVTLSSETTELTIAPPQTEARAAPPEVSGRSGDEDAAISASEILNNPIILQSPTNRSSGKLIASPDRVIFSSQVENPESEQQNPVAPGQQLSSSESSKSRPATPPPATPPIVDPTELLAASQELESMSQHTSRLLMQILLLGLFILVSSSLVIVYAIKFCLCRKRKQRRQLLMRRALIGDLSAVAGPPHSHQQHLGPNQFPSAATVSALTGRPNDNFLLTECACHLHHHHHASAVQQQLGAQHHLDCLNGAGLHYVPSGLGGAPTATGNSTPRSSSPTSAAAANQATASNGGSSMILALLQRLQQSLLAPCPSPVASGGHTTADQLQHANQQQQQQLAELVLAQLQAQLIASAGCFQGACICQQHQLLAAAAAPSQPAIRPPPYHELFRVQQRQVSPSAPPPPQLPATPQLQRRQQDINTLPTSFRRAQLDDNVVAPADDALGAPTRGEVE